MTNARQNRLFSRRPFKLFICMIILWSFLFSTVGGDVFLEVLLSDRYQGGKAWADVSSSGFTGVDSKGGVFPGTIFDLKAVNIPYNLGTITDTYQGSKSKTIIVIQDAHCDYNCQLSIRDLFGHFHDKYGVPLGLIEGGSGEYDISVFTDIEDLQTREKTADYFLKEGRINGAEIYAILNPDKITLKGAENKDSYLANLKSYRNNSKLKKQRTEIIEYLKESLTTLKQKIYSEELILLDKVKDQYKNDEIDFTVYLEMLSSKLNEANIDISKYKSLEQLIKVVQQEKGIDFRFAQADRELLVKEISNLVSTRALKTFTLKALEFKGGSISNTDFYTYLFKKAESFNINIESEYPELVKYKKYVDLYGSLDNVELFKELDLVEEDIFESLFENEDQKHLFELNKKLLTLDDLFNTSISSEEYNEYISNIKEYKVKNFITFINKISNKHNLNIKIPNTIKKLDSYASKMNSFYKFAYKRDAGFMHNIKKSFIDTDSLILVTGGFHNTNITDMFKEKGYSYITIMPKFTSCDDNPYYKLLSGSKSSAGNITQSCLSALAIPRMLTGIGIVTKDDKELFDISVKVVSALEQNGQITLPTDKGLIQLSYTQKKGASKVGEISGKDVFAVIVKKAKTSFGPAIGKIYVEDDNGKIKPSKEKLKINIMPFEGDLLCQLLTNKDKATYDKNKIPITMKVKESKNFRKTNDIVMKLDLIRKSAEQNPDIHADERKLLREILMHGFSLLSKGNVYVFEQTKDTPFIFGFSDVNHVVISEKLINDDIALFHEIAESYFQSYPLPQVEQEQGMTPHQYLRGIGKYEQNLNEGQVLVPGLQERIFGKEENDKLTEKLNKLAANMFLNTNEIDNDGIFLELPEGEEEAPLEDPYMINLDMGDNEYSSPKQTTNEQISLIVRIQQFFRGIFSAIIKGIRDNTYIFENLKIIKNLIVKSMSKFSKKIQLTKTEQGIMETFESRYEDLLNYAKDGFHSPLLKLGFAYGELTEEQQKEFRKAIEIKTTNTQIINMNNFNALGYIYEHLSSKQRKKAYEAMNALAYTEESQIGVALAYKSLNKQHQKMFYEKNLSGANTTWDSEKLYLLLILYNDLENHKKDEVLQLLKLYLENNKFQDWDILVNLYQEFKETNLGLSIYKVLVAKSKEQILLEDYDEIIAEPIFSSLGKMYRYVKNDDQKNEIYSILAKGLSEGYRDAVIGLANIFAYLPESEQIQLIQAFDEFAKKNPQQEHVLLSGYAIMFKNLKDKEKGIKKKQKSPPFNTRKPEIDSLDQQIADLIDKETESMGDIVIDTSNTFINPDKVVIAQIVSINDKLLEKNINKISEFDFKILGCAYSYLTDEQKETVFTLLVAKAESLNYFGVLGLAYAFSSLTPKQKKTAKEIILDYFKKTNTKELQIIELIEDTIPSAVVDEIFNYFIQDEIFQENDAFLELSRLYKHMPEGTHKTYVYNVLIEKALMGKQNAFEGLAKLYKYLSKEKKDKIYSMFLTFISKNHGVVLPCLAYLIEGEQDNLRRTFIESKLYNMPQNNFKALKPLAEVFTSLNNKTKKKVLDIVNGFISIDQKNHLIAIIASKLKEKADNEVKPQVVPTSNVTPIKTPFFKAGELFSLSDISALVSNVSNFEKVLEKAETDDRSVLSLGYMYGRLTPEKKEKAYKVLNKNSQDTAYMNAAVLALGLAYNFLTEEQQKQATEKFTKYDIASIFSKTFAEGEFNAYSCSYFYSALPLELRNELFNKFMYDENINNSQRYIILGSMYNALETQEQKDALYNMLVNEFKDVNNDAFVGLAIICKYLNKIKQDKVWEWFMIYKANKPEGIDPLCLYLMEAVRSEDEIKYMEDIVIEDIGTLTYDALTMYANIYPRLSEKMKKNVLDATDVLNDQAKWYIFAIMAFKIKENADSEDTAKHAPSSIFTPIKAPLNEAVGALSFSEIIVMNHLNSNFEEALKDINDGGNYSVLALGYMYGGLTEQQKETAYEILHSKIEDLNYWTASVIALGKAFEYLTKEQQEETTEKICEQDLEIIFDSSFSPSQYSIHSCRYLYSSLPLDVRNKILHKVMHDEEIVDIQRYNILGSIYNGLETEDQKTDIYIFLTDKFNAGDYDAIIGLAIMSKYLNDEQKDVVWGLFKEYQTILAELGQGIPLPCLYLIEGVRSQADKDIIEKIIEKLDVSNFNTLLILAHIYTSLSEDMKGKVLDATAVLSDQLKPYINGIIASEINEKKPEIGVVTGKPIVIPSHNVQISLMGEELQLLTQFNTTFEQVLKNIDEKDSFSLIALGHMHGTLENDEQKQTAYDILNSWIGNPVFQRAALLALGVAFKYLTDEQKEETTENFKNIVVNPLVGIGADTNDHSLYLYSQYFSSLPLSIRNESFENFSKAEHNNFQDNLKVLGSIYNGLETQEQKDRVFEILEQELNAGNIEAFEGLAIMSKHLTKEQKGKVWILYHSNYDKISSSDNFNTFIFYLIDAVVTDEDRAYIEEIISNLDMSDFWTQEKLVYLYSSLNEEIKKKVLKAVNDSDHSNKLSLQAILAAKIKENVYNNLYGQLDVLGADPKQALSFGKIGDKIFEAKLDINDNDLSALIGLALNFNKILNYAKNDDSYALKALGYGYGVFTEDQREEAYELLLEKGKALSYDALLGLCHAYNYLLDDTQRLKVIGLIDDYEKVNNFRCVGLHSLTIKVWLPKFRDSMYEALIKEDHQQDPVFYQGKNLSLAKLYRHLDEEQKNNAFNILIHNAHEGAYDAYEGLAIAYKDFNDQQKNKVWSIFDSSITSMINKFTPLCSYFLEDEQIADDEKQLIEEALLALELKDPTIMEILAKVYTKLSDKMKEKLTKAIDEQVDEKEKLYLQAIIASEVKKSSDIKTDFKINLPTIIFEDEQETIAKSINPETIFNKDELLAKDDIIANFDELLELAEKGTFDALITLGNAYGILTDELKEKAYEVLESEANNLTYYAILALCSAYQYLTEQQKEQTLTAINNYEELEKDIAVEFYDYIPEELSSEKINYAYKAYVKKIELGQLEGQYLALGKLFKYLETEEQRTNIFDFLIEQAKAASGSAYAGLAIAFKYFNKEQKDKTTAIFADLITINYVPSGYAYLILGETGAEKDLVDETILNMNFHDYESITTLAHVYTSLNESTRKKVLDTVNNWSDKLGGMFLQAIILNKLNEQAQHDKSKFADQVQSLQDALDNNSEKGMIFNAHDLIAKQKLRDNFDALLQLAIEGNDFALMALGYAYCILSKEQRDKAYQALYVHSVELSYPAIKGLYNAFDYLTDKQKEDLQKIINNFKEAINTTLFQFSDKFSGIVTTDEKQSKIIFDPESDEYKEIQEKIGWGKCKGFGKIYKYLETQEQQATILMCLINEEKTGNKDALIELAILYKYLEKPEKEKVWSLFVKHIADKTSSIPSCFAYLIEGEQSQENIEFLELTIKAMHLTDFNTLEILSHVYGSLSDEIRKNVIDAVDLLKDDAERNYLLAIIANKVLTTVNNTDATIEFVLGDDDLILEDADDSIDSNHIEASESSEIASFRRLEIDASRQKLMDILYDFFESTEEYEPQPELQNIMSSFDLFETINFEVLRQLSKNNKNINDLHVLIDTMKQMVQVYLHLFKGQEKDVSLEKVAEDSHNDLVGGRTIAKIILRLEKDVNATLNLLDSSGKDAFKSIEDAIQKFDANKTAQLITGGAENYSQEIMDHVSFAELINIVHQKGIRNLSSMLNQINAPKRLVTSFVEIFNNPSSKKDFDIPYYDARKQSHAHAPLPVQHIAQAFSKGQLVHKQAQLFPPSKLLILSDEKRAIMGIPLGSHSARIQYSAMPIQEGGRISINYTDSGPGFAPGSNIRAEILEKAFTEAGFKVRRNNRTITKEKVEAAGLNWNDISKEFIDNGWAKDVSTLTEDKISVNVNMYEKKEKIIKSIGEADFKAILAILRKIPDYALDIYFDKDSGAVSIDQLPEKLTFAIGLITSTKDLDLRINDEKDIFSEEDIINNLAQQLVKNGYLLRDGYADRPLNVFINEKTTPLGLFDSIISDDKKVVGEEGSHPEKGQILIDRMLNNLEKASAKGKVTILNDQINENPEYEKASQKSRIGTFLEIIYKADQTQKDDMRKTAAIAKLMENYCEKRTIGVKGEYSVEQLTLPVLGNEITFYVLKEKDSEKFSLAIAVLGDFYFDFKCKDLFRNKILPNNLLNLTDLNDILSAQNMFTIPRIKEFLGDVSFNEDILISKYEGSIINLLNNNVFLNNVSCQFEERYLNKDTSEDSVISNISMGATILNKGITIGRAVINSGDKVPEDFEGGILLARYTEPSDDPILEVAKGVVTTTGGLMSHAAIHVQYQKKPGLILNGADFNEQGLTFKQFKGKTKEKSIEIEGEKVVYYEVSDYQQEDIVVEDGDLICIDADKGIFYVLTKASDSKSLEAYDEYEDLKSNFKEIENPKLAVEAMFVKIENENLLRAVIKDLVSNSFVSEEVLNEAIIEVCEKYPDKKTLILKFVREQANHEIERFEANFREYEKVVSEIDDIEQLYLMVDGLMNQLQEILVLFNIVNGDGGIIKNKEQLEQIRTAIINIGQIKVEEAKNKLYGAKNKFSGSGLLALMRIKRKFHLFNQDLPPELLKKYNTKLKKREQDVEDQVGRGVLWKNKLLDRLSRPIAGGKGAHSGEILTALDVLITAKVLGEQLKVSTPIGFVIQPTGYYIWKQNGKPNHLESFLSVMLAYEYRDLVIKQNEELIEFLQGDKDERTDGDAQKEILGLLEELDIGLRGANNIDFIDSQVRLMRKIVKTIFKTYQKDQISKSLRKRLEVLGAVAVRSSGILEDSEDDAMAGTKTTVLNVIGVGNFEKAVIKVWESGAEGVLVEEMINAKISGIVFSADTVHKRTDRICLNAALGLAEGLVAQTVTNPDSWVIEKRKNKDDSYNIIERNIGNKTEMIVLDLEKSGETKQIEINDENIANAPSLSDQQIEAIAEISDNLAQFFGFQTDIEFSIDSDDRIIILQVRPITTIKESVKRGRNVLLQIEAETEAKDTIGKVIGTETIAVNDEGVLTGEIADINDPEFKIDVSTIAQRRAPPIEIVTKVNDLILHLKEIEISDSNRALLENLLRKFLIEFPNDIIILQEVKAGFYGIGKDNLLVINESILGNPVSLLHEIIEYTKHVDEVYIKGVENVVLEDSKAKQWLDDHEQKYSVLGNHDYFLNNREHYIIRAFTRMVFEKEDNELTEQIKLQNQLTDKYVKDTALKMLDLQTGENGSDKLSLMTQPCTIGLVLKADPSKGEDVLLDMLANEWKTISSKVDLKIALKRGVTIGKITYVIHIDDGTDESLKEYNEKIIQANKQNNNTKEQTFSWIISNDKRNENNDSLKELAKVSNLVGLKGEFLPVSWQMVAGPMFANFIHSKANNGDDADMMDSLIEGIANSVQMMTQGSISADTIEKMLKTQSLEQIFNGIYLILPIPKPLTGNIDMLIKADKAIQTSL